MPVGSTWYLVSYLGPPYMYSVQYVANSTSKGDVVGTVEQRRPQADFITSVNPDRRYLTLGAAIGAVIDLHLHKATGQPSPHPPVTIDQDGHGWTRVHTDDAFTNPPMRIVQLITGAHGTLYALDEHGRAWAYTESLTADGRESSAWQLLSPLPHSP